MNTWCTPPRKTNHRFFNLKGLQSYKGEKQAKAKAHFFFKSDCAHLPLPPQYCAKAES
jgi:hypothetical protein